MMNANTAKASIVISWRNLKII